MQIREVFRLSLTFGKGKGVMEPYTLATSERLCLAANLQRVR
jgi:hypothetical protein